MDVSRTFRASCSVAVAVLLCLCSAAAQTRSSYDPAQAGSSAKPRQGFVDFTLGRINSGDVNYGQCLDEGRKLLLEQTIESGYFWSNVVSISLLGFLFFILIYHHRVHGRRELIAAAALAQYEHALVRANAQVSDLTTKNQQLTNAVSTLRESALRTPSVSVTAPEETARPRPSTRATAAPVAQTAVLNKPATKPAPERSSSTKVAVASADQMGLFQPDVDLIMTVNSLKQQLAHSEEERKKLQGRLATAGRDLETGQQRNRQLKGE
jgi:hypothetical protein